MSRRKLIAASVVGLVLAVISNLALGLAYLGNSGSDIVGDAFGFLNNLLLGSLVVTLATGVASAVIAARSLLGQKPVRTAFRATIPILSGVSAAISWCIIGGAVFTAGVSDLVLRCQYVNGVCEAPPPDLTWLFILGGAFVIYLIAATLYGFAGTAQGVPVGVRTGLLVLLLLSLIPVANILGLTGFVIAAFKRTAERAAN